MKRRLFSITIIVILLFVFALSIIGCSEDGNDIPVDSVTLSESSLNIAVGAEQTLTATVLPENATNKNVTWTSSNPDVATVDENGKVTALAEGATVITATVSEKSATCQVTVSTPVVAVESVDLNKALLLLEIGNEQTLTATVLPENATNKNVTWTSSNLGVASVDENGNITALAEGTTVITAKAGDKSATCQVTVNTPVVAVESVELNNTELSLVIGDERTLTAIVLPENATNKSITWTSSNPTVATVDENGNIKALAEGSTVITAKVSNNKSASCAVTVSNPTNEVTAEQWQSVFPDMGVLDIDSNVTIKAYSDENEIIYTYEIANGCIKFIDIYSSFEGYIEWDKNTFEQNNESNTCTQYIYDQDAGRWVSRNYELPIYISSDMYLFVLKYLEYNNFEYNVQESVYYSKAPVIIELPAELNTVYEVTDIKVKFVDGKLVSFEGNFVSIYNGNRSDWGVIKLEFSKYGETTVTLPMV